MRSEFSFARLSFSRRAMRACLFRWTCSHPQTDPLSKRRLGSRAPPPNERQQQREDSAAASIRRKPGADHVGDDGEDALCEGLTHANRAASPRRRQSSFSHTCAHTRSIYHLLPLQLFSAAPPIMIFCHVVHIPVLEGSCPSALPLCKSVRHER